MEREIALGTGIGEGESFRLLVDSLKDVAVYRLDPEGRVASWNAGAEHLKGYTREEILGHHFERFYTPEDRALGRPRELLRRAREEGRIFGEGWRVRKDGTRFWADIVLSSVRDANGRLHGYAKVTRDMTERRRLTFLGEAALILSRSLDYRTTVPEIARLVVPFLADWCTIHLLEGSHLRLLALAHARPEKAALAAAGDRFVAVDASMPGIAEAVRSCKPALFTEVDEAALADASGDPKQLDLLRALGARSVLVVPLLAGAECMGTMTLAFADSDRHYTQSDVHTATELATRCAMAIENARVHEQLRIEHDLLDVVLRELPAGVVIAHAASRRIVMSNREAEQVMGTRVQGMTIEEYAAIPRWRPDGSPLSPAETPLLRALEEGEPIDLELHFLRDTRRVVAANARPVRDSQGKVVAACTVLQDVTSRRLAEQAAQEEAVFRERFIAILAHDLRNPLQATIMASDLLLRQGVDPATMKAVQRISSSSRRMQRMISDVLDLARARLGGGIPISPRESSLADVCRDVVEELQVSNPSCTLAFEARTTGWGHWDPERLAQVVSNLVGNAVRYGCEHGPVTVELREEPGCTVIAVGNRGEVIPPDVMPYLFDPFRRGTQRPPASDSGLGLGLYIANEIVKGHGGTIEVFSNERDGTCFRVRFPR